MNEHIKEQTENLPILGFRPCRPSFVIRVRNSDERSLSFVGNRKIGRKQFFSMCNRFCGDENKDFCVSSPIHDGSLCVGVIVQIWQKLETKNDVSSMRHGVIVERR